MASKDVALHSGADYYWDQLNEAVFTVHSSSSSSSSRTSERLGTNRSTWRTDRDMGLMNAIGLQRRNPTTSVTSQGTQTPVPQLQNAETQTEREVPEPSTASTSSEGDGHEFAATGEDAISRIQRLMAEGGMTAVVQREQSTTMASMGGFGNNIIVSHRIHRGSQTGGEASGADRSSPQPSTSMVTEAEIERQILCEALQSISDPCIASNGAQTDGHGGGEQSQSSSPMERPFEISDLSNNNDSHHLPGSDHFSGTDSNAGESQNR